MTAPIANPSPIKPGELRRFVAFADLGPEQIIPLAAEIEVLEAEEGRVLMALGSHDSDDYFLLRGTIHLRGRAGQITEVRAGSEAAREPLASLRPCQYDVIAAGPVKYFTMPRRLLAQLRREAPRDEGTLGEITMSLAARRHPVFLDFRHDLKTNRVVLPTLPQVALRIRQAVEEGRADMGRLATLVSGDPAIAAKLIKVANSPIYRAPRPITTLQQALTRLGLNTTRELVVCFTYKDLFKTADADLSRRMQQLWRRSIEVAAISRILAEMTPGLDPEQAQLAGLLQEVGALPLLRYLAAAEVPQTPEQVDAVIDQLKGEVGAMTLSKWGLPRELVAAAEHVGDWYYEGEEGVDYVDVTLIATLHALLKSPQARRLPRMDTLPAFHKLALGKLGPEQSLEVLEKAAGRISEVRGLLA